jgi:hypothetical protein
VDESEDGEVIARKLWVLEGDCDFDSVVLNKHIVDNRDDITITLSLDELNVRWPFVSCVLECPFHGVLGSWLVRDLVLFVFITNMHSFKWSSCWRIFDFWWSLLFLFLLLWNNRLIHLR